MKSAHSALILTWPLFTIICSLSFIGCGDDSIPTELPPDNGGNEQLATSPLAMPGFDLPVPSAIPLNDGQKQTSYTEADLFEPGYSYQTGLPFQNFTELSSTGQFAANWSGGLTGAAYAMYRFTVDGYDRLPHLRYGWEVPPAPVGSAYIGLANFTMDRWDWWQCDSGGWFTFGDITPFMRSSDSAMIAAVVVVGQSTSELHYLRLGPNGVEAKLNALPDIGIAPLEVRLSGTGSISAFGGIESYSWDPDGNGTYDSAGPDVFTDHVYEEPGTYHPWMLVETEHGEVDSASTELRALPAWTHTFGGGEGERFYGVDSDGTAVYAIGTTSSFAGPNPAVLLTKFSLEGELEWARAWYGPGSDYAYAVKATSQGIFIAGQTDSFGGGLFDVLIQRWTPEGDLAWTKTWGWSGSDIGLDIDVAENVIYVCGNSSSFQDAQGDAVVLAMDTDGNHLWSRAFGHMTSGGESAVALDAWRSILDDVTVHIAANQTKGNYTILYAKFDSDGNELDMQGFSSDVNTYARDIYVGGLLNPEPYICGYDDSLATQYGLLVSVDPAPLAVRWDWDGKTIARGVFRSGDSLIVAGTSGFSNEDIFLCRISLLGAAESSLVWRAPDGVEETFGLGRFPGLGLIVCGSAQSAAGEWQSQALNISTLAKTWSASSATSYPPAEISVGTPLGTTVEVTDGVLDVSAGVEPSGLIAAHSTRF